MAKRKTTTKNKPGWVKTSLTKLASACACCTKWALRAMPLAMISACVSFGIFELWSSALVNRNFTIGGDTLLLNGQVCDINEARLEMLRLGKVARGRNLLDPFLLAEIKQMYESSRWIKKVSSIRRIFPNRIAVDFILRTPAAQVRTAGIFHQRYWLVDSEGVLLPVKARISQYDRIPLICATNGHIKIDIDREHKWNDEAVRDSLALLRLFKNEPRVAENLSVRAITVNRSTLKDRVAGRSVSRPRLSIKTAEGVDVYWGKYNNNDLPGEISTSEKIGNLCQLLDQKYTVPGIRLKIHTSVPGYDFPNH